MNRLIAWIILLTLTGCATMATDQGDESDSVDAEPDSTEKVVERHLPDGPSDEGASASDSDPDDTEVEAEARLYRGDDRTVNMPEPREAIELDGSGVTLNFEQAPITEVVHSILGEILELDYVVEHPLKGEITLRTRSPVPRDQLLSILESLLQSNGITMVRDPNDRYYVSGSQNLSRMVPGVTSPETKGAGYANVVIPLEYISATEMAEILRPVATGDAFVRVDSKRNLLVLAGTRNQLDGWMQIINTFDVNQLKGMSVGVFPLENTEVADVKAALGQIMRAEGEEPSGLASMIRVLPLEQLNSILVVTPRAHYLDQVRTWIERLDQAQSTSDEPQLHVYSVQNGTASHLANLLKSIFGGAGGIGREDGADRARDEGVSPGFTPMGSDSSSSRRGGSNMDMPSSGNNNSTPKGASFSLGDNIRIVADEYNNSLLVYAPAKEYRKIQKALERLDILPTQVLIEASIIEVTLSDDLQYGVEWFIENELGGGREGDATLDLFGQSGLGAIGQGFSYTVENKAGTLRAVVNALAEESLINVISTPSIMVLDNHTAFIHVGDQQPVQSAQTITDGGRITSSINFKDTGVKLQVTPSVNAGGMVTMQIDQSVTDVGEVDSATDQRSFLERNITSRVAIRTGESVVLGGLIRDNTTTGKSGIPLLHQIPVLGNLFGQTTSNSRRTELLVFLTPRVIKNEQDLRDITEEMRARMKGLENFDDLPLESLPEAATEQTE